VFIEHVGIPTLAAIRPAVDALQEPGMHRRVQLIVSGGIRSGADVAKALALGADAVSIGTAALVALGDNDPIHETDYHAIGTTAGAYDDWP
jgi:glutamate synthase domain-containing protein 2